MATLASAFDRKLSSRTLLPGSAVEQSAGVRLWIPLAIFALSAVTAFAATALELDPALLGKLPTYLLGIVAALVLQRLRRVPWLTGLVLYNSYLALLGLAGMIAAYAAATDGQPLVDASLLAIDRMLGYDWLVYARFYAGHHAVARVILPAYHVAYVMPTVTIALLVVTGRVMRVERYLLAMLIATTLTVALFALFPARTAWGHLHVPIALLRDIGNLPLPTESWEHDLILLRAGAITFIGRGAGVVAFPSLHCATALITGWAAWPTRLRVPFLAIHGATLLATPIIGGHYMADMLGGLAVTIAAVGGATWAHRRMCPHPPSCRVGPGMT